MDKSTEIHTTAGGLSSVDADAVVKDELKRIMAAAPSLPVGEGGELNEQFEQLWTETTAELLRGVSKMAAEFWFLQGKYASSFTAAPVGQASYAMFEAGWNAGFQEAQEPDRFPWQNRCEVRFQELFPIPAEPKEQK